MGDQEEGRFVFFGCVHWSLIRKGIVYLKGIVTLSVKRFKKGKEASRNCNIRSIKSKYDVSKKVEINVLIVIFI